MKLGTVFKAVIRQSLKKVITKFAGQNGGNFNVSNQNY